MPGQAPFKISSPVSFFNAAPTGGKPTLIAHAYETVPSPQALLVPIVIERVSKGRYGFHVQVEMPEVAGGFGAADPGRSEHRRAPASAAARRSASSTPSAPAGACRSRGS